MPRAKTPLYLHEEIMLLALRDEEGTVEFGSMYGYALGGAILAELLLAGRISVEEGKRKLVNLVSDEPIGSAPPPGMSTRSNQRRMRGPLVP